MPLSLCAALPAPPLPLVHTNLSSSLPLVFYTFIMHNPCSVLLHCAYPKLCPIFVAQCPMLCPISGPLHVFFSLPYMLFLTSSDSGLA